MATVTSLTAARMQAIEAASVVDGDVVAGHLILTKHDGSSIDAGNVVGPQGATGPAGPMNSGIPGEIKLWPSAALPNAAQYGTWAWCNGDAFDIAAWPEAAANIDDVWDTALGAAAPGAGKFRVPDLRGLTPVAPDAMPLGGTRANRTTRAQAVSLAARTGEETHVLAATEMPAHTHTFTGTAMGTHAHTATFAGTAMAGHTHTFTGTAHSHSHNHAMTTNAGGANKDVKYDNIQQGTGGGTTVIKDVGGVTGAATGTAVNVVTDTDATAATATGSNSSVSAGTPAGTVTVAAASAGTPAGTNANTGGGGAHENMQPSIFVPYIVKLG